MKHPEIPIPSAVVEAMPKIVSSMMLKSNDERIKLRASELLLKFMQYNVSLDPPEARHQPQPQIINVGVNVDNRTESSKALQFMERFREGRVLERLDDEGTG